MNNIDELTFEQKREIDEYLEGYKNNPSNSNKWRIGLHAHIDDLIQSYKEKWELERAIEEVANFDVDKGTIYRIKRIAELNRLKEGK